MTIDFALVDVFAERPLTGNPLAVVPDADAVTRQQMREIAREFNQSETTFLIAAARSDVAVRLVSLTAAGHEVGGAGHNALGAWLWLADAGRVAAGHHRQQIGEHILDVEVTDREAGGHTVSMAQSAPQFGAVLGAVSEVAEALGIHSGDVDTSMPSQVVSTGAGHLLVPLATRAAVDRVEPDARALRSLLAECGGEGVYVYTTEDGEVGADAYTRFFNPTMGIAEDPATGTAAGPLAAQLVRLGRVPDGTSVRIEQGHALGRPSRLLVRVDGDDVRLSGRGLVVAEGRIAV